MKQILEKSIIFNVIILLCILWPIFTFLVCMGLLNWVKFLDSLDIKEVL